MSDRLPPDENRTGPLRIIYFGTPTYAVPALERLANDERIDLRLVVTQPDRPAGRRHQLTPPPVKIAAERLGLQVYQPESLRTPDAREPLVLSGADLFVVAAYGLIFGPKTLAIPRITSLNLHASLLPRYRGASPIAASILCGDAETGVSLMGMETGLDTGPVYATTRTPIARDDTSESLTIRLAELGADLVGEQILDIANGNITPIPQPSDGASMTRPLTKLDGAMDWSEPAEQLERQVRAMWPWPRAWSLVRGNRIQVHRANAISGKLDGAPGTVTAGDGDPIVVCGEGGLRLDAIQEAGAKAVSGKAWVAGLRGDLPRFEAPPDIQERLPIVTLV